MVSKYTSNSNVNQSTYNISFCSSYASCSSEPFAKLESRQAATNGSVVPLSAGNLMASSLAKRIHYPANQVEGQRANTPSFETMNSNSKLNLQALLSKKEPLWTARNAQGNGEAGSANNFSQSTLPRSEQSVFTMFKKSSDNAQSNGQTSQAQNSVPQGIKNAADCAQRLQERLAELRRSCSRTQVTFPARQVSQASVGPQ